MNPQEFFKIADYLANIKDEGISKEISNRTAMNRLYYGIFHLVQIKLKIIIPRTEIKRCHAYVKEQIENSNIRSDYADLEEYRVDVDYNLTNKIDYNHYNDALRLKNRILNKISELDFFTYDNDDEFFYSNLKKI